MSFDNKEALSPIPSAEFLLVLQYFCATMNLQQTWGKGTEFTKYETKCLHCKFLCTHSYKRHVAACCFAAGEPTAHTQDHEKRTQTWNILTTWFCKLSRHHQWFLLEHLSLKVRVCLRAPLREAREFNFSQHLHFSSFESTEMVMTLSSASLISWCVLDLSKLEQHAFPLLKPLQYFFTCVPKYLIENPFSA